MELIGEGKHGKVYDRGDGTVVKVMDDHSEWNISEVLKGLELEYIANYVSNDSISESEVIIIKEKILPLDNHRKYVLDNLSATWDTHELHSNSLFEYLDKYLECTAVKPLTLLSHYSIRRLLKREIIKTDMFTSLFMLVEELKLHGIYNIDWNPANFGLKNNHLALFELGGAKIH